MFLNSLNAAYPNKRSSQLTVASVPRMPRKFEPILLSESSREEEVQPKSNADVTQETSPHNMSMIVVDSDDSDDCVIIDGTSSQTLLTDSRSKELNLSKTSGSSSSDPLGEIRHQAEDECVDCKTCGRRVPRASMQLHEGRCKPVAASSSTNESNPTVNSAATPTKAGADLTSITFLKGLLPFWSTEHLQALLDSHNGQVEQSYEGALALASNGDPDSIPVAMRDAILRSLTLGFAGSRSLDDDNDDTPSKRPRYEASTSSSSNSLNPPEFSSYAFRLLLSIGVSAEGNREATTLGALVPDNGRLIGAVVFNMMIDFDFLCNEIPALRRLRGEQLTIISGRDQLVGNIPEGVHVHYPPLPEYGSHHSKGLLCYYEGGDKGRGTRDGPHCVFVVCTANFLHVDVRMKTNGVWAAVAPMKGATSASSCEFEDDLYSYFEHYNARNHAVKTIRSKGELSSTKASTSSTRQEVVDSSRIRKYDFSAVRGVKLIASAPGIHAGGWQGVHSGPEAWRWGHLAVRRFLASHNRKKASRVGSISSSSSSSSSSRVDNDEPRRLVCQFTSMGNVHEKWLYHQFADSMVGAHDQDTDMRRYGAKLKPPQGGKWAATLPIELVVPSVEKVRSSTEGYAGGGSIPLPHKNIGKVRLHSTSSALFIYFRRCS